MAVIMKHFSDDEHAAVIEGRPDLHDGTFGVTTATRHPPYVFSIRGSSCLVHKVVRVELHWWRIARQGHALVKMTRPHMIAQTICRQHVQLKRDHARTCRIPRADAVLCGRCHGEPASFGANGAATKAGLTKPIAHVRLGCVVEGY